LNGLPKHLSNLPGVSVDGAGVGIPLSSSGGFFRTPDPTKLVANTHEASKIALSDFHKSFVELAGGAGLDENSFRVVGEELHDRFEIQFLGDQRAAALAAKQFSASLTLGKGVWKKQAASGPMETEVQYVFV